MALKSIKGTQTEKNLLKAFAGESQARNRYNMAAAEAEKQGYIAIANLFNKTALQESVHAREMFKFLEGGMLQIEAMYPAGKIEDVLASLYSAASGEHEEYTILYPSFAEIARQEGFEAVAKTFDYISIAEQEHERQFLDFAEDVKNHRVFSRDHKVTWRCMNCGYIHEGTDAPKVCLACAKPQGYFEIVKF